MNDLDLLRLAAKVAGIEFKWREGDPKWGPEHVGPAAFMNGCWQPWNPLASDGDALRLAAKLRFGFRYFTGVIEVVKYGKGGHESCFDHRLRATSDGDICAETRRAIVGAAAAIGSERG